MTKNQFRALVISVLAVSLLGTFIDILWPSEITEQLTAYAEQLEPEWSDTKLAFLIVWAFALIICMIGSLIGLLLFKNWGRILFLLGFVITLPMYSFLGVTVSGSISELLYDLGAYGDGAILALCYFSPVAKYFEKEI
jgi:tryptophan-rich sensory protein